ncbi:MAG: hypothetical protein AMXMBFR7_25490 [Planctomycetota bacterium]
MAKGFCYFLPGPGQRNAEQLLPLGLLPLVPGEGVASRALGSHAGGAGALCWIETPGVSWSYDPSAQVWTKVSAAEVGAKADYWIGYAKDELPTPGSLARASMLDGAGIQLGAHPWQVPILKQLPQVVSWSPGLGLVARRPAEYREIFADTERFFQVYFGFDENTEGMSFEWYVKLAVRGLALNYRVGVVEAGLLECLTTDLVRRICEVMADVDFVIETAKKKLAEVSSVAGGASGPPGSAA